MLLAAAATAAAGQETAVDTTHRPVDLLAPGTVIRQGPPANWSHLVIKSHPRIRDEDVERVGETTARLSSVIFTVVVANTKAHPSNPSAFIFDRAAVGVGTNINGQDVVVSPDTQKDLGANMGFLARQVLSRTYERQKDVTLIAKSPTAAVIDAPVAMRRGNRHRFVDFRYLLLVDTASGNLDVLLWLVDRDRNGQSIGARGSIEVLPPSKIEDAALIVDDSEYTLGMPSDLAFAVMRLPEGKQRLAMPEDIRPILGRKQFLSKDFQVMESRLRSLIKVEVPRTN